MKIRFTFLLLALTTTAIAQKITTLRIDPGNARGGTATQLFDSVTYIPLETTDSSIFGEIQHLQTSRHYFVFYDNDKNAIFIFNKQGKFISSIHRTALGKQLRRSQYFSGLDKFTLEKTSENIYIVYDDGTSADSEKKLAIFTAHGQLLSIKALNGHFNHLLTSFSFIDPHTTVFAAEAQDSAAEQPIQIFKDFETPVASLDPAGGNAINRAFFDGYHPQPSSSTLPVWSRLYDLHIYSFKSPKEVLALRLLLPKSLSLDSVFFYDTTLHNDLLKTQRYISQNRTLVSGLTGLYRLKDYLFFGLEKSTITSFRDFYFYSLKQGNLYQTQAITPDASCYYLPVFSGSLAGVDEQHIYTSISSVTMLRVHADSAPKDPHYPESLQDYFDTATRMSNPVIVQLKIKNNL